MRLFKDLFLKRHLFSICIYLIIVILGNLSYLTIMFFFSESSQFGSESLEAMKGYLSIKHLLALTIFYGMSFLASFFLQVHLANQFSINLNVDMDQNLNVSSFKDHPEISQALVIKDISAEFARFGNNIILPSSEIVKNIVSFSMMVAAIAFTQPALLLPSLILIILYSGFWAATRRYFVKIAKRTSFLLYERQKYAEFKYQDFNELNAHSNSSPIQSKFEGVLREIAKLNVISKTVAIAPRAVIETFVLCGLVLSATWFDKGTIILLGLAGLKLVISAQSISVGISNLQLNWPAFLEYSKRRQLYKASQTDQLTLKSKNFPRLIPSGFYSPAIVDVKFIVPSNIDLQGINICLLRGPSGIGKSTFLNCFCGFHKFEYSSSLAVEKGNNDVCFLGQNTQIAMGTIRQNFDYTTNYNWDYNIALKLYEAFFGFEALTKIKKDEEFEEFLNKNIGVNSGISGGEAKRMRIMASLLTNAKLFIWDEPFDGIHPEKVHLIINYLKERTEKTFLIIDHNSILTKDVNAIIQFSKSEQNGNVVICEFLKGGI